MAQDLSNQPFNTPTVKTNMGAYNFSPQFALQVQVGSKPHTIRAPRKDGRLPKLNERLSFYTGMRTKACRKLGAANCIAVFPIEITRSAILFENEDQAIEYDTVMQFIGHEMNPARHRTDRIAKKDGFAYFTDMRDWFEKTHGLPFNGHLIVWKPEPQQMTDNRSINA